VAEYRIQDRMQIAPERLMARDKSGILNLVQYDMIDAVLVSDDRILSVHVGRAAYQVPIGPEDKDAVTALLDYVARSSGEATF
jgi:hypothetical protein